MVRFEVVQNIPSPYRLHLFNEMWRQLQELEINFHVNFMAIGHPERPASWSHPNIVFPHTYWRDYGYRFHHFNPGMIMYLRRLNPEFLLVGSPIDTFTSLAIAWLCPAKVRCAWTEGQTQNPGKMKGFIGWLKRLTYSRYPLVGVPGSEGVKYIKLLQDGTYRKMPETVMLPNIVDESRFRPREDWPSHEIAIVRKGLLGSTYSRICLISARLDPVKGLVEFLDALPDHALLKEWKFVIMGQGPLREDIIGKAHARGLDDQIQILDFVPYDEMPKYYAAADLFLLPSLQDQNPLSVVEALHSGLPVALSDRAGNIVEAVTEGENGWRLPVLNQRQFKLVLQNVFSTSETRLREMGRRSVDVNARFWNTQKCVGRFLSCIVGDWATKV